MLLSAKLVSDRPEEKKSIGVRRRHSPFEAPPKFFFRAAATAAATLFFGRAMRRSRRRAVARHLIT
jgi:hypothetical protein